MNSNYTRTIWKIWGSSHSDVFAVGGLGGGAIILHYDGNTWTPMTGAQGLLLDVWGSSPI